MKMQPKVVYGRVEWVRAVSVQTPLTMFVPALFATPFPCTLSAISNDGSGVTLEVHAPPFVSFLPGVTFELDERVPLGLKTVATGVITEP